MAGFLPCVPAEFKKIPWATIAIIHGMWHADIVKNMVDRAVQELIQLDVLENNIQIHTIPGSLELPYAADVLYTSCPKIDAILAFGIVLQGETTHDQMVLANVIQGFNLVIQRHRKPIINEVIGVKSLEDARKRAANNHENKGVEAVFAVSQLLSWQHSLSSS